MESRIWKIVTPRALLCYSKIMWYATQLLPTVASQYLASRAQTSFYFSVSLSLPFASARCTWINVAWCCLWSPAMLSVALTRRDHNERGGRYNKAGLVMYSDCRMAKMLGVCWDSRWLALLSLPLAQPRQDRLNCLISNRASEETASSTLFNVKSAMERKG